MGGNGCSFRNVEIYLCRKLTSEKLKSIGSHFGISDAAVSQVCKRLDKKLEDDRRLRIQVSNIKKRIRKTSEVETWPRGVVRQFHRPTKTCQPAPALDGQDIYPLHSLQTTR